MITVFLMKHTTHRTTSNLKLMSPCSTICVFLVMLILLFPTLVCTNSWHHLQTFQQNDTGVSGAVNSVRVQIHLPRRIDRISWLTTGEAPRARGCKGKKMLCDARCYIHRLYIVANRATNSFSSEGFLYPFSHIMIEK